MELSEVDVATHSLEAFRPLIGPERYARLESSARLTRSLLTGSVVWNVSSTAHGGGVAEMLQVLVGYICASGIDCRWVVIDCPPDFFTITKRIHNRIHGMQGDAGMLGPSEARHYSSVSSDNFTAIHRRVRPGDIVLLHDPQTAGMARSLRDAGTMVVWRSHIGSEKTNAWTEEAWEFLRPHLSACDAFVFSRRAYVPRWIPAELVSIIPPSIDPFSPKNQPLSDGDVHVLLSRIGVTTGTADRQANFLRHDGTMGEVIHQAKVVATGPMNEIPGNLAVQVSRWDRLKDMRGVMTGFASGVVGRVDAQLLLVGPSVEGVADDPEGSDVLAECVATWESLPSRSRRRIRLITLPMDDVDENAVMVNALQRSATVIVQKSLAEGFGLTVAEGMWKGKPILASRVGGIVDQVAPDTGILLDDPTDLDAYGDSLAALLERPDEVTWRGGNARRRVLEEFVGDHHLLQYADLMRQLRAVGGSTDPSSG
jgi:trehalose synthase